MTSSNTNVKSLCDEYLSSNCSEDQIIRILNKLLGLSDKMQKDVYVFLSEKGIMKLLAALKDNNSDVRKTSCRVLLEMLYNNELLQNIFCEKFNFNPIGNVICINWLPKYLKENLKIDERVINEIKNSNYNYNKPLKYWMWPENTKYADDVLPDPQKYLIGFYYANKNSLYSGNDERNSDERVDTRLLTTKLENENFEEEKINYVAAGSGSESSAKINENIKEKYMMTDYENNNKKPINTKQNLVLEVNNLLDKIKINNTTSVNADKKLVENKKLKEEYKKNVKEKGYSKSIDNNIPKKGGNSGNNNSSNSVTTNQAASQNSVNSNVDTNTSRIKINKAKK